MNNYTTHDISVLITCYKEGKLLYRALNSVLEQTVKGFGIIIVNDYSPDEETNRVCREIEKKKLAKIIWRTENGGSSAARNTGVSQTNSEIIVPLDGDDELPENAISVILSSFNTQPEIDFIFGDYKLIDAETGGKSIVYCNVISNSEYFLNPFALAENWILLGQCPYKKSLWKDVGGFPIEFSYTVEDVVYWRRAILQGFKGLYIPKALYYWHRSINGKNNNNTESDYLPVRKDSLPFYDAFNPEYGKKMRKYIYRYYSSRLMAKELLGFCKEEKYFLSKIEILKAHLMNTSILFYKGIRYTKNILHHAKTS